MWETQGKHGTWPGRPGPRRLAPAVTTTPRGRQQRSAPQTRSEDSSLLGVRRRHQRAGSSQPRASAGRAKSGGSRRQPVGPLFCKKNLTRTRSFLYILLGWFLAITTKVSSVNKDHTACKALNIYSLFLYRESLPALVLKHVTIQFPETERTGYFALSVGTGGGDRTESPRALRGSAWAAETQDCRGRRRRRDRRGLRSRTDQPEALGGGAI